MEGDVQPIEHTVSGTCSYTADARDYADWGGDPDDWPGLLDTLGVEGELWKCPHEPLEGRDLCPFHIPSDDLPDGVDENDAFLSAIEASTGDDPGANRKKQFLGASFHEINLPDVSLRDDSDEPIRLLGASFENGLQYGTDSSPSIDLSFATVEGKTDISSDEGPERYRDELLVEKLARLFWFNRLAKSIPFFDPKPVYLFFGFWIFFDMAILNVYRELSGSTHSLLVDPFSITVPLGIVLGTVGVVYMRDAYADTVHELVERDQIKKADRSQFEETISLRMRLGAYAVAVFLHGVNFLVLVGLERLFEIQGIVTAIVANFFLLPVIYLPLMVDFVVMYFSIQFLLPRQLASSDVSLFFHDPRNVGGFAPIGQLLKRTYYLYTAGLLLYFVLIYGSVIVSKAVQSPYPEPGIIVATFFSIAWALGVGSIVYSIYKVHRVMAKEKEIHADQLQSTIYTVLDDPPNLNSRASKQDKLEETYRRLEQIRTTKEYPTTFEMWSQIAISVLLPQILNVALQLGT